MYTYIYIYICHHDAIDQLFQTFQGSSPHARWGSLDFVKSATHSLSHSRLPTHTSPPSVCQLVVTVGTKRTPDRMPGQKEYQRLPEYIYIYAYIYIYIYICQIECHLVGVTRTQAFFLQFSFATKGCHSKLLVVLVWFLQCAVPL